MLNSAHEGLANGNYDRHVLPDMDKIVGGHYRLRKRLGAGSFGEIYRAENVKTHKSVAVKLESVKTRVPQLSYESKVYSIFSGGTGIPKVHWYGSDETHNIMVMDLLGKSLEDLLVACHQKMSLKTVLMLADQMLSCVEFIHNKNFIHRDIKPDNFVMGIGDTAAQVFIIDYGLAKKYRDQHTHMHIPYVEGKSLTGTARYASVGALRGVEQSRRDDLESLGFVWMYLLRGSLPWMGLNGRNQREKYDKICEVKAKTPFEELCNGFPDEFVRYFRTVRALRFTEAPNYTELRQMFRELFIREGFIYDYKYDWCKDAAIPRTLSGSSSMPRFPRKLEETKEEDKAKKKKVTLADAPAPTPAPAPNAPLTGAQSQPNLLSTPRPESSMPGKERRLSREVPSSARRTVRTNIPQSTLADNRRTERTAKQAPTTKIPQRRVKIEDTPAKPAQSTLTSARRVSTSSKDDLTPRPREASGSRITSDTRKRIRGSTNQNAIRSTLMPNWMAGPKRPPSARRP